MGPGLADGFGSVSAEGFDEGPVGVHLHDAAVHGDGDDPVGEVPPHRERLAGNSDHASFGDVTFDHQLAFRWGTGGL